MTKRIRMTGEETRFCEQEIKRAWGTDGAGYSDQVAADNINAQKFVKKEVTPASVAELRRKLKFGRVKSNKKTALVGQRKNKGNTKSRNILDLLSDLKANIAEIEERLNQPFTLKEVLK